MHHPRVRWDNVELQAVAEAALAAEADRIVWFRLHGALLAHIGPAAPTPAQVIDWIVSGKAAIALAEAREHARTFLSSRSVLIDGGEEWTLQPITSRPVTVRGFATGGTCDLPERCRGWRGDPARQTHVTLALDGGTSVSIAVNELLTSGLRHR